MRYPEFPVVGFLSAVLVLVPLPHQIRAGNIACIALIFWLFQHCFAAGVDSIIFAGNVNNTAPVWCDITTKLRDGAIIALSASTLCICKHLEFISSLRPISSGTIQCRRKIFELVMCVGMPALWMFLSYCFQTARFFINEDFGCDTGWYHNDAPNALLLGPPLLFSMITLIYGFITLYRLAKTQTSFHVLPHLKSRDSLSSRQYFRLMAMGMSLGIWGVVWFSLEIHFMATLGSYPIPSWKEIHKNNSNVIELPTIVLGPVIVRRFYTFWWSVPGGAIMFFLLFGTSHDGLYEYVKFWIWFRTTVLRQLREKTVINKVSTLRSQSAPRYRIDTLVFSDDLSLDFSSYGIDTAVVYDDLESKLPTTPDQALGSRTPLPAKG